MGHLTIKMLALTGLIYFDDYLVFYAAQFSLHFLIVNSKVYNGQILLLFVSTCML